jgi:transcription elongation factor GreA
LVVANSTPSISEAARLFAGSLPPAKHLESQEALRFARWFGEERAATEVRPSDIESYVDTFGATAPNAAARAEALKNFLAYAHKQKILPERFVSHVRIVRIRRSGTRLIKTASSASQVPDLQVSLEGKAALETELEELKNQRPRIAADLRAARADGDVRENAPLDAARDAQGQLEARIRELEGMLRHAVVVDATSDAQAAKDAARVGCSVVICNIATGAQLAYQLVQPTEARGGSGRLSVESPVGQALVGHRAGDEVEVSAPSGRLRFRIEKIEA